MIVPPDLLNFKSIFKYGVASLLLVIPLYPKFPIFSISGTYVAVRAEDFIIGFLALIYLFYIVKSSKKEIFKDKLNLAFALFIVIGFISVLSAINFSIIRFTHLYIDHPLLQQTI